MINLEKAEDIVNNIDLLKTAFDAYARVAPRAYVKDGKPFDTVTYYNGTYGVYDGLIADKKERELWQTPLLADVVDDLAPEEVAILVRDGYAVTCSDIWRLNEYGWRDVTPYNQERPSTIIRWMGPNGQELSWERHILTSPYRVCLDGASPHTHFYYRMGIEDFGVIKLNLVTGACGLIRLV